MGPLDLLLLKEKIFSSGRRGGGGGGGGGVFSIYIYIHIIYIYILYWLLFSVGNRTLLDMLCCVVAATDRL